MAKYGAVYIAHNLKDGEAVFKVGKTERNVEERMAELTAETSNLGRYSAIGWCVVSDVDAAETASHRRLSPFRIQDNREFFQGPLADVIRIVRECCQPFLVSNYMPEAGPVPRAPPSDIDDILDKVQGRTHKNLQDAYKHSYEALKVAKDDATWLLGRCAELKQRAHQLGITVSISRGAFDKFFPDGSLRDFSLCTIMLHGELLNEPARVEESIYEYQEGKWRSKRRVMADDGRWLRLSLSMEPKRGTLPGSQDRLLMSHSIDIECALVDIESQSHSQATSFNVRHYDAAKAKFRDRTEAFRALVGTVAANTVSPPKLERTSAGRGYRGRYKFKTNSFDLKANLAELKPWLVK